MKKWMWWVIGGIVAYVAYTMFVKPPSDPSGEGEQIANARLAKARANNI